MVMTHDGVVQNRNDRDPKCAMKVRQDLTEVRIGKN